METTSGWERASAWFLARKFKVDLALAGALFAVSSFLTITVGTVPLSVLAVTFLLCAPLPWRRTRPTLSASMVGVAGLVHLMLITSLQDPFVTASRPLVADVAVLISLYTVTVHGPRLAPRVALAVAILGVGYYSFLIYAQRSWMYSSGQRLTNAVAIAVVGWLLVLTVWALGQARRARVAAVAALEARATQLEQERDQQFMLAATAERSRIAREMHDIVAHSLTIVIAQADGGRYTAAQDPEAATQALTTIAETGRAALADMRRLLGVLREDNDQAASPTIPSLTPQPSHLDLDSLIEQMRSSGLTVSAVRVGQAVRLPSGVGLVAYRICQEALTNALKHGGPGVAVTVVTTWRANHLELTISDDGRGASASTDGMGHGLIGMRERVALFHGNLTAGPRPGGGFQVHATLPLEVQSTPALSVDDPDEPSATPLEVAE